MSSFLFGQITIEKDELLSYCIRKDLIGNTTPYYEFIISPDRKYILESYHYSHTTIWEEADSVQLFLISNLDTLNKTYVATFKQAPGKWVGFDMLETQYPTWSQNSDTIFIVLKNSTINSDTAIWEGFAINISSITSIGTNYNSTLPKKIITALNKPNPFQAKTEIQYSIPTANFVAISIYNNKGRLLRMLEQKKRKAGKYIAIWDGKDNNGNPMASGEYYYQVISGDYITTKKMLLLK